MLVGRTGFAFVICVADGKAWITTGRRVVGITADTTPIDTGRIGPICLLAFLVILTYLTGGGRTIADGSGGIAAIVIGRVTDLTALIVDANGFV